MTVVFFLFSRIYVSSVINLWKEVSTSVVVEQRFTFMFTEEALCGP